MQESGVATMRYDTVVIGGGLAGLIAAVELGRRGRRVVVFEKAKRVGGRAITTRRGRADWNLGPHALYRRGDAAVILKELGVPFAGGRPRASGGFAIAGGRKHALPGGFVSLVSTSLLGLSAKLELASVLSSLQRLDAGGLRDVTLDVWLERRARHEGVRALVRALTRLTTYCDAPAEISAGDAIEQIQLALSSNVLYLDGGWQTLVDGLAGAARDAGVTIAEGVAVRGIETAGAVEAVRLDDGTRVHARSVIAAVPPATVVGLVSGMGDGPRAALENLVPVRAACLDVTLSSLPASRATFALGIDQPLYFSVHSAVARLAPKPTAVVHAMKYLKTGGAGEEARSTEAELEALLDLVQPAWRARVLDRRFLPALVVSHAFPAASRGGKRGRPHVDAAGVKGLYLCGDWVGERGFIADAAAASARAAAERCHEALGAWAADTA